MVRGSRKGTSRPAALDVDYLQDLRQVIGRPKLLAQLSGLEWQDAGGSPRGFKCRLPLVFAGEELQPEGLYVDIYWKPTSVPGGADKLSMGLFYRGRRIVAIDENGISDHRNDVGVGRPFFGQVVPFPHLHMLCAESVDGYAEPLNRVPLADLWTLFLDKANIVNAPPLAMPTLPPEQPDLPLVSP